MKRNKEIKKGDKIWLNATYLSEDSFCTVKKVSKKGTLVTVIIENHIPYEITLYGHASSSILSGYDRYYGNRDVSYTCEYNIIAEKTRMYDRDQRYKEAGKALLNLVKYL